MPMSTSTSTSTFTDTINPFNALIHSYQTLLSNYKYVRDDNDHMHVYLSKIRILNNKIIKMVNDICELNESIVKKQMVELSQEEKDELLNLNVKLTFLNLLWNMP